MLSCLTAPSGGDAHLLGGQCGDCTYEGEGKKINLSPQETAVAPNLTVRENLEFVCGIYGIGKAEAGAKAKDMIERCSLGEIAGKKGQDAFRRVAETAFYCYGAYLRTGNSLSG